MTLRLRWHCKPTDRELFTQLLEELRTMSQALTNLQTAVSELKTTSDAIAAKLGQPPAIQGEDPAAVQAAADEVTTINTALKAALNPPPTA